MTKAYTITSLTARGHTLYWDGEDFTSDEEMALVFLSKYEATADLVDLDRKGHDVEMNVHYQLKASEH